MNIKNSRIIESIRVGAWPDANWDVIPGYGSTIEFNLKPYDDVYNDMVSASILELLKQITTFCYGVWATGWVFGPHQGKLTLNCDTLREDLKKEKVYVSVEEMYSFVLMMAHFNGWKIYGLNRKGLVVPDRRIRSVGLSTKSLSVESRLLAALFKKSVVVTKQTEAWIDSLDFCEGQPRHLHDLIYSGHTWESLSEVPGFSEEIRTDLARYLDELDVELGMQPFKLKTLPLPLG